jgi:hypothetical protein
MKTEEDIKEEDILLLSKSIFTAKCLLGQFLLDFNTSLVEGYRNAILSLVQIYNASATVQDFIEDERKKMFVPVLEPLDEDYIKKIIAAINSFDAAIKKTTSPDVEVKLLAAELNGYTQVLTNTVNMHKLMLELVSTGEKVKIWMNAVINNKPDPKLKFENDNLYKEINDISDKILEHINSKKDFEKFAMPAIEKRMRQIDLRCGGRDEYLREKIIFLLYWLFNYLKISSSDIQKSDAIENSDTFHKVEQYISLIENQIRSPTIPYAELLDEKIKCIKKMLRQVISLRYFINYHNPTEFVRLEKQFLEFDKLDDNVKKDFISKLFANFKVAAEAVDILTNFKVEIEEIKRINDDIHAKFLDSRDYADVHVPEIYIYWLTTLSLPPIAYNIPIGPYRIAYEKMKCMIQSLKGRSNKIELLRDMYKSQLGNVISMSYDESKKELDNATTELEYLYNNYGKPDELNKQFKTTNDRIASYVLSFYTSNRSDKDFDKFLTKQIEIVEQYTDSRISDKVLSRNLKYAIQTMDEVITTILMDKIGNDYGNWLFFKDASSLYGAAYLKLNNSINYNETKYANEIKSNVPKEFDNILQIVISRETSQLPITTQPAKVSGFTQFISSFDYTRKPDHVTALEALADINMGDDDVKVMLKNFKGENRLNKLCTFYNIYPLEGDTENEITGVFFDEFCVYCTVPDWYSIDGFLLNFINKTANDDTRRMIKDLILAFFKLDEHMNIFTAFQFAALLIHKNKTIPKPATKSYLPDGPKDINEMISYFASFFGTEDGPFVKFFTDIRNEDKVKKDIEAIKQRHGIFHDSAQSSYANEIMCYVFDCARRENLHFPLADFYTINPKWHVIIKDYKLTHPLEYNRGRREAVNFYKGMTEKFTTASLNALYDYELAIFGYYTSPVYYIPENLTRTLKLVGQKKDEKGGEYNVRSWITWHNPEIASFLEYYKPAKPKPTEYKLFKDDIDTMKLFESTVVLKFKKIDPKDLKELALKYQNYKEKITAKCASEFEALAAPYDPAQNADEAFLNTVDYRYAWIFDLFASLGFGAVTVPTPKVMQNSANSCYCHTAFQLLARIPEYGNCSDMGLRAAIRYLQYENSVTPKDDAFKTMDDIRREFAASIGDSETRQEDSGDFIRYINNMYFNQGNDIECTLFKNETTAYTMDGMKRKYIIKKSGQTNQLELNMHENTDLLETLIQSFSATTYYRDTTTGDALDDPGSAYSEKARDNARRIKEERENEGHKLTEEYQTIIPLTFPKYLILHYIKDTDNLRIKGCFDSFDLGGFRYRVIAIGLHTGVRDGGHWRSIVERYGEFYTLDDLSSSATKYDIQNVSEDIEQQASVIVCEKCDKTIHPTPREILIEKEFKTNGAFKTHKEKYENAEKDRDAAKGAIRAIEGKIQAATNEDKPDQAKIEKLAKEKTEKEAELAVAVLSLKILNDAHKLYNEIISLEGLEKAIENTLTPDYSVSEDADLKNTVQTLKNV